MRLIDGDKLVSIFAQRKEVWRGNGVLPSTESLMWIAAMDITKNVPTVDAVPLDKLCEWFAEYCINIPCETCRHFSYDYCTAIGDMDKPCPNKAEDWQRAINEWMEGLDAAD